MLGCLSCSRGSVMKFCLAIKIPEKNNISYISYYDRLRLSITKDLVLKFNITSLIVQKDHKFIIEQIENIDIILVQRSMYSDCLNLQNMEYFSSCCISALIVYLNISNPDITQEFLDNYVYLLSDNMEDMLPFINYTKTKYGLRMLQMDLCQPIYCIKKLKERQDLFINLKNNNLKVLNIEKLFRDLPDIESLINFYKDVDISLNDLKNDISNCIKICKFINIYTILQKSSDLFKINIDDLISNFNLEYIRDDLNIFVKESDEYLDLSIKIYQEIESDTEMYLKQLELPINYTVIKTIKQERRLKILNKDLLDKEININSKIFKKGNEKNKGRNNFLISSKSGTSKSGISKLGNSKLVNSKLGNYLNSSQMKDNYEYLDTLNTNNNSYNFFSQSHSTQFSKKSSDQQSSNSNWFDGNYTYNQSSQILESDENMSFETSIKSDSGQTSSVDIEDVNIENSTLICLSEKNEYCVYTTNMLESYNHKLQDSYNQIIEISGEMCKIHLQKTRDKLKILNDTFEEIALVDVCISICKWSYKYDCCLPKIDEFICISSAYHPILKKSDSIHNNYYVCPYLNINLITGPNMSGKTTYQKLLFSICILHQIGYPIPAKHATLRMFKKIFYKSDKNSSIPDLLHFFDNLSVDEDTIIFADEIGKGMHYDFLVSFYITVIYKMISNKSYMLMITHHEVVLNYIMHMQCINILKCSNHKVTSGISSEFSVLDICKEYLPFSIYEDMLAVPNKSIRNMPYDNKLIRYALQIKRCKTDEEIKRLIDLIVIKKVQKKN